MKRLIRLLTCLVLMAFVFAGVSYADPYETRPHEWRDTQTFQKQVVINDKFTLKAGSELLTEDGTASGAGLSPLIWGDLPRIQMMVDPTTGHFIGDDFTFTMSTSYTTAYDYVLAGTRGTFAALAGDPNGVAKVMTADGSDNDESNVNHAINPGPIKLDASTDWWFETRVKINQITTAQGIYAGLLLDSVTMGVDFITDDTMALKVQSLLGFQIISATDMAATWQSIMILGGGARVAVNAALATASTGWVKLGMKSVSGTVTFYVNGVANATTTTSAATNFPLDQYVVPAFATKVGSPLEVANNLSVDWWYLAQLR